uniref:Uncharacterized protein n=1 Tax=Anguilla anguilla TaxID=7936 RepID=A0A0E9UKF3_ANGAN
MPATSRTQKGRETSVPFLPASPLPDFFLVIMNEIKPEIKYQ